ncbi:hypothetical protein F5883DRAFT_421761 [Diaporthe sp. PMI_573]|nr:hypothetical protein F5883DRAFT_421761 [Diaporthaceae sp. PMI_573]
MVQLGSLLSNFLAWAIISGESRVTAYVLLVNIPQGTRGYTETCRRVLNQPVKCDKSLKWVDGTTNFYDEDTISNVCTVSCKRSLDKYLDQVKAACDTSRYDGDDGLSYHGGYKVQQFWERFNMLCMNNLAGENCNQVMGKLMGINPRNQRVASPADANVNCNECALSAMKMQLEMPSVSYMQADLVEFVSRIASSCKTTVSISPVPSASPPWVMLAAQTATSTAPGGGQADTHPASTTTGPEPTTLVE